MNETTGYRQDADVVTDPPTGPWESAADTLREWDPKWAELCFKMSTNPWTHSILPRKFIELVSVSLNAACTNLNSDGTRHHIRAALEAGATREEILFALKCGSKETSAMKVPAGTRVHGGGQHEARWKRQ